MTITHGSNVLADPARLYGASGLGVVSTVGIQRANMLRAASARFRPRGNVRIELSFTVARHHESAAAAEDFFLTHAQDVSGQAAATILCGAPGDTQLLTLPSSILSVTSSSRSGNKTTHAYRIRGGQIS